MRRNNHPVFSMDFVLLLFGVLASLSWHCFLTNNHRSLFTSQVRKRALRVKRKKTIVVVHFSFGRKHFAPKCPESHATFICTQPTSALHFGQKLSHNIDEAGLRTSVVSAPCFFRLPVIDCTKMARTSQSFDDMLQNLDFINSYPNEIRNSSLSPGAKIDEYFDRRSVLLDEASAYFDAEDENNPFDCAGTPKENAVPASARAKRSKSAKKRQPLRDSADVNMEPDAEKDDTPAEEASYAMKTPKRVAVKSPKSGKSRRRSSLKGSVVARRSTRIAAKEKELVRVAIAQVNNEPSSAVRPSRAKSVGARSARKTMDVKRRKTKRSMSVDDAGNDVPEVPVVQANSSFSSIVLLEEVEDVPSARGRSSTSSVKSTATFVVSSPSERNEETHDDVFEEDREVVFPAISNASRRRSKSVTIHDRPRTVIIPVDDDGDSDVADGVPDAPVEQPVATTASARRRRAASLRDLTLMPMPMCPATETTLTRVQPFRFRTDERARKRKPTDDCDGHWKKPKIYVPEGLKGNIMSLSFFERQELAHKKREQLQKEEERRQKEMRKFHANPAPGSHSSQSSFFSTTSAKPRRQPPKEESFQFRANPIPKSVLKPKKPMEVEHKPPTCPKPFQLPGDERMRKRRSYDRRQKERQAAEERERERLRQEDEQRLDKEYEEARRRTNFKANPVPNWVKLAPAAVIAAPDFSDDE